MTWTINQKLSYLMTLPWTVTVTRPDGEEYLVAEVQEIPDAIATGADDRELARDLWDSLWASLSARFEFGDAIVLPASVTLPWDRGEAPPTPRQPIVRQLVQGDAWQAYRLSASMTTAAVGAGASGRAA
jgi:hypothetical protein